LSSESFVRHNWCQSAVTSETVKCCWSPGLAYMPLLTELQQVSRFQCRTQKCVGFVYFIFTEMTKLAIRDNRLSDMYASRVSGECRILPVLLRLQCFARTIVVRFKDKKNVNILSRQEM